MNEQEEKPKMFFNKSYEEIINAFAYLAVPKINALYSIYSHEKQVRREAAQWWRSIDKPDKEQFFKENWSSIFGWDFESTHAVLDYKNNIDYIVLLYSKIKSWKP